MNVNGAGAGWMCDRSQKWQLREENQAPYFHRLCKEISRLNDAPVLKDP
jgi:hypothetical protein